VDVDPLAPAAVAARPTHGVVHGGVAAAIGQVDLGALRQQYSTALFQPQNAAPCSGTWANWPALPFTGPPC
jgi:hypothetical protein